MPPPPPAPLMMAECDLLLVMRTLPAPDPMNPGKTYTIYGFTLYRIRDGKLFEQWDDTRIKNPPQPYLQKTLSELRKSATGG